MTPADKRALALVCAAGRAKAVPWKGHWSAGGHHVAAQTIRRLVRSGMLELDSPIVAVPTKRGAETAEPAEAYLADDGLDIAAVAKRAWSDEVNEDDGAWAPPDHRRGEDPVPVDVVIKR